MHLLERHKKLYMSYVRTGLIAVLFLLVAVPFVKKVVNGGTSYTPDARYMVVLNGEELGYVSDENIADSALLSARSKLSAEKSGIALVEANMELFTEGKGGSVLSEQEMTDTIYTALSENAVDSDSNHAAYTVRIDDFTVTLASMDDVVSLFEKVKNKYSNSNEFTVELVEDNSGAYDTMKANFVSADVTTNAAAKVLASMDGTEETHAVDDSTVLSDGVLSVEFAENIEIIQTKTEKFNIVSVDDAYEMITKEHAEKETYTVTSGDCLTSIAEKNGLTLDELFALNYELNADTVLYEGDVLTVTVPAAEISVKVVEESSYEEDYSAPVEYVDNNKLYVGKENVLQNAVPGHRSVVALVTYINGAESTREIINETVQRTAVPAIIERGTLTPPTYIKPVNSSNVTSPFGYRIHPITGAYTFHSGVDWYVPSGTAVKASASGTVIRAGWYSSYGYCVDIRHSDGSVTRYGHLSQFAVSYGQNVVQGQVVAYSGSTGVSTGPHLHFEIIIGGGSVNPLNYVK